MLGPHLLKALLLGQVVNAAGSLAWLYVTLYLVDDRHLAATAAGLVTGAYGLGLIAGNLFGGSAGDRWGLKPTLLVSLGGWAVGCALFPLAPTDLLGPLGLVAGLTSGAGRPVMGALVATGLTNSLPDGGLTRREGIAMSRAAMNVGTAVGPPLGGLLAAHHFDVVFALDALTSLVLLAVVARFVPAAARPAAVPRGHLLGVLGQDRRMRGLVGGVLAVDTTYRLLYTALPLFLLAHGAPAVVYGLTITLNCVVIVVLEPRIARRLGGHEAHRVVAAGFAVVGVGWLLLGAVPFVVGALAAVLIITLGEMLYKPTATALAAELAPDGMVGRYQSLYASASIGGMLLSPVLGTALYAAAPGAVFPVAGLLALVSAAAYVRRPALVDA